MFPRPVSLLLLALLVSLPAAAQNADLTLRLSPETSYNAGEVSTVKATVTNLGPDASSAAGVRLTKPVQRFINAATFGCIEFSDSVLCNIPTLAAGQSHDFLVPFSPPDAAGTFTLNARTESFTIDPNHENDAASATGSVVGTTDLVVTLAHDFSFRPGKTSRIYLTVGNKATRRPDSVTAFVTFPEPLVVTSHYLSCKDVDGAPGSYRCTFPGFGRDERGAIYFDVLAAPSEHPVTITASVDSPEPEWNPADNRASLIEPVYDVYDLDLRISPPPDSLDAENRMIAEFLFSNVSDSPALQVTAEIITFPADADASAASNGWTCKRSDLYRLLCTRPSIAPHSTSGLRLPVRFSSHEIRGAFAANVTQKPAPEFRMQTQSVQVDAVFYRFFRVTNMADSGPGSLRQAIFDANAACSSDDGKLPCSIRFEIPSPVPSEGWFTIAPRTPLPRITVTDLMVDGEAQTVFTGNSNPAGPEIFLSGGQAGNDAEGLDLYTSTAHVRGLAIGGFAGNGIRSLRRPIAITRHQIERNFLGTDPTGTTAVPNGLRGLTGDHFGGEITGNVISGNRRSGVFLTDFSNATIRDNRIGVAAATDEEIGNGASGIFVGGSSSALLEHNVIANSSDFGVAIAIAQASQAQILENRIFHNAQPGIDLGLDGPTLDGAPRITSARFDPSTGETVVEGVIHEPPIANYPRTVTVFVYANTRDEAGGEFFLGAAVADDNGQFALRYRGDMTGKYIDAMKYQVTDFGDGFARGSSEFGPRTRM